MTEVEFRLYQKAIKPPFVVLKADVTEHEFFEFASEDLSSELLNGVLHVYSPASIEHERIFRFLLSLLNDFLQRKDLGEVLGSHVVMRLNPNDIPEPDLLVLTPNSKAKLQETYVDGPADLVVEILSPSTRQIDLETKIPLYLREGVRELWIIDPAARTLTVFFPGKDATVYEKDDQVVSRVIPGFWIKVNWLWPETAASSLECLETILESD